MSLSQLYEYGMLLKKVKKIATLVILILGLLLFLAWLFGYLAGKAI